MELPYVGGSEEVPMSGVTKFLLEKLIYAPVNSMTKDIIAAAYPPNASMQTLNSGTW